MAYIEIELRLLRRIPILTYGYHCALKQKMNNSINPFVECCYACNVYDTLLPQQPTTLTIMVSYFLLLKRLWGRQTKGRRTQVKICSNFYLLLLLLLLLFVVAAEFFETFSSADIVIFVQSVRQFPDSKRRYLKNNSKDVESKSCCDLTFLSF